MDFSRGIPAMLSLLTLLIVSILSSSIVEARTGAPICSPQIDPVTGIGRRICTIVQPSDATAQSAIRSSPKLIAYSKLPLASPKSVVTGPTTYFPQRSIGSTERYSKTTTLASRLCKDKDKVSIVNIDSNTEVAPSRVISCHPAGKSINQPKPFFPYRRATQMSRVQEFQDNTLYGFKHNRATPTR